MLQKKCLQFENYSWGWTLPPPPVSEDIPPILPDTYLCALYRDVSFEILVELIHISLSQKHPNLPQKLKPKIGKLVC